MATVVHNQRMDTSPESTSSCREEGTGLSLPPAYSIFLELLLSLLVVGAGLLALGDGQDVTAVAAFLAAGCGIGVAISRRTRRTMVLRHMREVHPGAPLPRGW